MFYREYWHPKTTPASALATLGPRISATININVYTLDPQPRMEAGGGSINALEKLGLYGKTLPRFPDEAAIFAYLDGVFTELATAGWEETEESLSLRVFLHGQKGTGKYWNIHLTTNTCVIHFGKAARRRTLTYNAGTHTEKPFATRDEALAAYHKMIGEKLKKGYVELFPRATAFSSPTAPAPKTATKRT